MGYVALSRVRTLAGLKLMGLNNLALQVNPSVVELDGELLRQSEEVQQYIASITAEEKEKLYSQFLQRCGKIQENINVH
jgi:hypothetical protein